MSKVKPKSFAEFKAALPPAKRKCRACALPDDLRAEMRAAREEHGGSYPQINKWLADVHGISMPEESIRKHLHGRHDE